MVMPQMFDTLLDTFNAITGNVLITILIIFAVLVVGFMVAGLDFRFALLVCTPLVVAGTVFLPTWVQGILIMLLLGLGGYFAINYFTERV